MGDECLVATAKTLAQQLKRSSDQLCRYGGEEFVVLLPNTDTIGAKCVAQQLRQAISELVINDDLHITASLGVAAMVPQLSDTGVNLVDQADQALYKAKHLGKNRVIDFTDLPPATPDT